MDKNCIERPDVQDEWRIGLVALFAQHGPLIEVDGTPVQLVCEGLVEVGSWGMVGKYMPIEEAEELLFA
jgi:hypothetical protein